MYCSPAQIEKKRLEALQKLEQKKISSPIKASASNTIKENALGFSASSPRFKNPTSYQNRTANYRKPYEKPHNKFTNTANQTVKVDFYGQANRTVLTINLISSERFSVKTSSFFSPAIEVFKSISSKNYDPNSRNWSFDIKDYDSLICKLAVFKSHNVIIEPLPQFVLNCLKNPIPVCDIDLTKLDIELSKTLLPFQVEGLRYGVEREGRCLIADDMGLGKTFQALAIMNYYKSDWPLLIVTTASMKNIWEETICKYISSLSVLQIQYMVSTKDYIGDSTVLIVSHDLMSRCCDKLLERKYGCIIIDESHNLKNYKSKSTQAAVKLTKNAKRVILLSGTPALSRPSELHTQLSLIDNRFFGSFIEYAKRYCDLQKTCFGLDSSGRSNLQELEIILGKRFMIRRTKEEVLGSLPKKTQEIIKLNVNLDGLDRESKALLDSLAKQYSNVKKKDKHALLLTFFSETAKIKVPSVCSYIYQVLEKKTKFLVFAHHHIMLNALEEMLKKKELKYIRIDGSTSGEQRKYFVDKFQTDEKCICALLSITAANAGITLTAAQLVIFAELHWNPSILSQAEARAHRIGQANPVIIQYLVAAGTVDDSIWPLLQEKQNILSEMGLCKDSLTNVDVKHQDSHRQNLNVSTLGLTNARTLDITTYFKSPEKKRVETDVNVSTIDEDDALNDGFDDVLCNMDISI